MCTREQRSKTCECIYKSRCRDKEKLEGAEKRTKGEHFFRTTAAADARYVCAHNYTMSIVWKWTEIETEKEKNVRPIVFSVTRICMFG